MPTPTRGTAAATLAGAGVGLLVLALVMTVPVALGGAWGVLLAPLAGLGVALLVFRSLRRVCSTGDRGGRSLAVLGCGLLASIAVVGISFGGMLLLVPTLLLLLATAVTPAGPVRSAPRCPPPTPAP